MLGFVYYSARKNCSSYEWITWLGRPSLPQGADLSSVLDSVEHGLLFCELVWSSRGVLPHVSTHTRTVGFLFEIESLAHTTNRPILGPCLMCDVLLRSIRRCAVECGVCEIDRSADIKRLTVSKYVHNWTVRVRVGHG